MLSSKPPAGMTGMQPICQERNQKNPNWRPLTSAFRRHVAVIAIYAVASLAYTYPLAFESSKVPYNTGDPLLLAWILSWEKHALSANTGHFFDGNIFYPIGGSLFLSDLLIGALPIFSFFTLFVNPLQAYNLTIIIALILNAFFMYLLVRRIIEDAIAAFAAGLIYAFNPLTLAQLSHGQLMMFWYTPLAMISLESLLRRCGYWKLASFTFLFWLQFLTSVYLGFIGSIAIGWLLIFGLPREKGFITKRSTLKYLGLGIAVSVPFLFVLLGYLRESELWGVSRSLQEATIFSAELKNYLATDRYQVFYSSLLSNFAARVAPHEKYLFIGVVPWILAVSAPTFLRKRALGRNVAMLRLSGLAITITSVVMSLGPYLIWNDQLTNIPLPYLAAYYAIPALAAIRAVARFGFGATIGVAFLTATSLFALGGWVRRVKSWKTLGRTIPLLLTILIAMEYIRLPMPMAPVQPTPAVITQFLSDPAANPAIFLPLASQDKYGGFVYQETRRMWWSVSTPARIANGYSGAVPPPYWEISQLTNDDSPETITLVLAALGVKGLVIEKWLMDDRNLAEWENFLATTSLAEVVKSTPEFLLVRLRSIRPQPESVRAPSLVFPYKLVPANTSMKMGYYLVSSSDDVWINSNSLGMRKAKLEWFSGNELILNENVNVMLPLFVLPRLHKAISIGEVRTPTRAGVYEVRITVASFQASQFVEVVDGTYPTSLSHSKELRAKYSLRLAIPAITESRRILVDLEAINMGGAIWLSERPGLSSGIVRLGYVWFNGTEPVEARAVLSGRLTMSWDIPPRGSYRFRSSIPAPIRPGTYTLLIGLVSEGVAWFHSVNPDTTPAIIIQMEVK